MGENQQEIVFQIDGIHCAACIWLIEKLPQILPGVEDVKLNWARHTAQVRWQTDQVQLSRIAETLNQLGYQPHPFHESEMEARRNLENRRHLIRIGIAAAAAGNNMLIAAALYLGMFSFMSPGMTQMLRVASCLVGLASLLGPGRIFLVGAVNAVRTRTAHMDLPIALGLAVGGIAGLINTIRGTGEIYFDSLSVLIFLLLVGRWIQFRQQNRAANAIEMLYRLTPQKARLMVDGESVETYLDLVQPGDLLEIRPGDLVPADAVVIDGTTRIDESILTGESRPALKQVDDVVLAGTQNLERVIVARTTAIGRQTRLSKIVELVEKASLEKPQIVQWANRIGGYFVIVVTLIALATLSYWLLVEPAVAVNRTVALLIVACPCALAMATPLTVSVALGKAARQKIMIKGGDVFQQLNKPGLIWLDKTGTLTEGRVEVVAWYGDRECQPAVAAVESKSSHPIARAVTDFVKAEFDESEVQDFTVDPVGGVSAVVAGRQIWIGNQPFLQSQEIQIPPELAGEAARAIDEGLSPCWVALEQQAVALFVLGDRLREDTLSVLQTLETAGWRLGILSGDHEQIVKQVAARLRLPEAMAHGGLTPEDKLDMVRESMQHHETVLMIGDGVNDSVALAAASVGIAVHNGAEASLAAAPVYFADQGLAPILKLLSMSRSTQRTMRRNLSISLGYNILAASLAALGFINPLVAAILMPISSLTVVGISLTAGGGKDPAGSAQRGFRKSSSLLCRFGISAFGTGRRALGTSI